MLALLSSISFASPLLLLGLLALPAIWWIMRLTPPRPREMAFGAFPLLKRLAKAEETPQQTPWWLLLLRMLIAALVIIALAGPAYRQLPVPVYEKQDAVIVLLDLSPSMLAADVKPSRLIQARRSTSPRRTSCRCPGCAPSARS